MKTYVIGVAVMFALFAAAMSPLGTDWNRETATESVCIEVQMQTGDHKRIVVAKPTYADLSIGSSHGTYYLQTWERGRFFFFPVRAGVLLKYGVIDVDAYC